MMMLVTPRWSEGPCPARQVGDCLRLDAGIYRPRRNLAELVQWDHSSRCLRASAPPLSTAPTTVALTVWASPGEGDAQRPAENR